MNKKDKRSRKTARAVQNALLRLLCERRIDEIKIVDLCTAAWQRKACREQPHDCQWKYL